jgi:hypothetical protein
MSRSWARFSVPTLLGVIGLGVGAWLGVTLGPERETSPLRSNESVEGSLAAGAEALPAVAPGSAPTHSGDDAEIRAVLEREIEARLRLEDEVVALRAEVAALGQSSGDPSLTESSLAPERDVRSARPWFDAEGLRNAGVDALEIQTLRERFEEIELARLYLRDQAAREGWAGSARYREESRALDARFEGLRDELGPSGYDRLLFAIGRPNRARVQDLLESAPAREAGMKPDDVIVSYDGRRIFTVSELRRATTEGQAGAPVEVRLERNGETIRLFVPRGPLGVRLAPARRPPLR